MPGVTEWARRTTNFPAHNFSFVFSLWCQVCYRKPQIPCWWIWYYVDPSFLITESAKRSMLLNYFLGWAYWIWFSEQLKQQRKCIDPITCDSSFWVEPCWLWFSTQILSVAPLYHLELVLTTLQSHSHSERSSEAWSWTCLTTTLGRREWERTRRVADTLGDQKLWIIISGEPGLTSVVCTHPKPTKMHPFEPVSQVEKLMQFI